MTARNRELMILVLAGVVASVAFAGAWFREAAAIDRVLAAYPELNDDAFVAANLERWLG